MFLQSATAMQRNAQSIGSIIPASVPGLLFADCPELIGAGMQYGREEEIYGEGEEAEFVYMVVKGAVRTHKLLSDGRRQIGAFHLESDLFGFEVGNLHRLSAEAISDTTVLIFKRRTLEAVAARNVEVARKLWGLTARSLDDVEQNMLLWGRKTATERVTSFLLEMQERMQGSASINLPMRRRDIGDYLGLALDTMSRALSQLKDEGTVGLSDSRNIRVEKRAKLENLADQEPL
ncbi:MAG: helix-turn-helix domain-containing protein [Hyphomicrobiales bacterium]|nr:helix-turn-helix domain-containing protein [Hyphomicrobiales bacterium]